MINKIDFRYLVGAVSAISVGVLTMVGTIQQYIHFSGVANEMGFAVMSLMLGVFMLIGIKK